MPAAASEPTATAAPLVGVLALQGDFEDHEAALRAFGLRTRQVRTAAQLQGLDGLVLPGGESTTMLRLLRVEGLWGPLGEFLRGGTPVLATCAGMILLAEHVEQPRQDSYGLLPITVVRNGYGRQVHSGTHPLDVAAGAVPGPLASGVTGTFIRAPRITAVHDEALEVLARRDGDPVLVQRGHILAACFHPELTPRHPVTRLFADAVRAHATHQSAAT